jgi:tetratricopeptide (TPR) repeat protein
MTVQLASPKRPSLEGTCCSDAACEAGNTELGALVLCNMSHLATWQGHPRVGVDHAVAAQGWAIRTDDKPLQAYAADVAARAYAAAGEYRACMEELGAAQAALASSDGSPTLVHFYDESLHASVRGLCLLQFNRPMESVAASRAALAALDPAFVRNVAMTTLDLGGAYAKFGRPDEAAAEVTKAATLAGRNRSTRLIGEIQSARRELEPWSDTRAVKELDGVLAEAGIT